jgi:hypothetical protein
MPAEARPTPLEQFRAWLVRSVETTQPTGDWQAGYINAIQNALIEFDIAQGREAADALAVPQVQDEADRLTVGVSGPAIQPAESRSDSLRHLARLMPAGAKPLPRPDPVLSGDGRSSGRREESPTTAPAPAQVEEPCETPRSLNT